MNDTRPITIAPVRKSMVAGLSCWSSSKPKRRSDLPPRLWR